MSYADQQINIVYNYNIYTPTFPSPMLPLVIA